VAARAEERREPWKDPQAKAYIRIENVTKKFGEFVAVSDVSLSIYQGEIFCLLGGSGCGKTTLLRMLAGFETPTAGRIFIDGQDMEGVPPYKRPVNMMFQSYALFPHMSVEGNVAFGLKQEGAPKAEIAERVQAMLSMVKLEQFAKRKPHQLSGGQRQRVALARALIKRPKLLLLDEPLGALDKKLREHTQFELVNLQEKLGVTFVVVTHDQEEAMTLASRIGVMNHGRIVQVGTPHEIYEFPGTRFVSEFIGNVNMFEGRIVEDEPDHVTINSPELGGTIYVGHGVSAAPNAVVWAAVRPEKVMIDRAPPGAPSGVPDNVLAQAGADAAGVPRCNTAQGVVKEIAYMGDVSIYIVQLETGKQLRVTQPNTHRHADAPLTWDERVWVSWHESSAVVVTE
jgi:putrescine transport system ATP-binding protein